MTSDEVKQARQTLGLSKSRMARALVVHVNTYGKWESGEQAAPAVAVTAINMLLWVHERGDLDAWLEHVEA